MRRFINNVEYLFYIKASSMTRIITTISNFEFQSESEITSKSGISSSNCDSSITSENPGLLLNSSKNNTASCFSNRMATSREVLPSRSI